MELTINVDEIRDLEIKSSTGITYHLVESSTLQSLKERIEELLAHSRKTLYTQSELMELKEVGQKTIKRWVAMGLSEIHDGNRIYYDVEELEALLKSNKK